MCDQFLLDDISSKNPKTVLGAFSDISEMRERDEIQEEDANILFPYLNELLLHNNYNIRFQAFRTLYRFLKEFNDYLPNTTDALPNIINSLKCVNTDILNKSKKCVTIILEVEEPKKWWPILEPVVFNSKSLKQRIAILTILLDHSEEIPLTSIIKLLDDPAYQIQSLAMELLETYDQDKLQEALEKARKQLGIVVNKRKLKKFDNKNKKGPVKKPKRERISAEERERRREAAQKAKEEQILKMKLEDEEKKRKEDAKIFGAGQSLHDIMSNPASQKTSRNITANTSVNKLTPLEIPQKPRTEAPKQDISEMPSTATDGHSLIFAHSEIINENRKQNLQNQELQDFDESGMIGGDQSIIQQNKLNISPIPTQDDKKDLNQIIDEENGFLQSNLSESTAGTEVNKDRENSSTNSGIPNTKTQKNRMLPEKITDDSIDDIVFEEVYGEAPKRDIKKYQPVKKQIIKETKPITNEKKKSSQEFDVGSVFDKESVTSEADGNENYKPMQLDTFTKSTTAPLETKPNSKKEGVSVQLQDLSQLNWKEKIEYLKFLHEKMRTNVKIDVPAFQLLDSVMTASNPIHKKVAPMLSKVIADIILLHPEVIMPFLQEILYFVLRSQRLFDPGDQVFKKIVYTIFLEAPSDEVINCLLNYPNRVASHVEHLILTLYQRKQNIILNRLDLFNLLCFLIHDAHPKAVKLSNLDGMTSQPIHLQAIEELLQLIAEMQPKEYRQFVLSQPHKDRKVLISYMPVHLPEEQAPSADSEEQGIDSIDPMKIILTQFKKGNDSNLKALLNGFQRVEIKSFKHVSQMFVRLLIFLASLTEEKINLNSESVDGICCSQFGVPQLLRVLRMDDIESSMIIGLSRFVWHCPADTLNGAQKYYPRLYELYCKSDGNDRQSILLIAFAIQECTQKPFIDTEDIDYQHKKNIIQYFKQLNPEEDLNENAEEEDEKPQENSIVSDK